MEKVVVELEVKSKKGVKEVEKLNKNLSNTKTEAKSAGKSLEGVAGGAVGKFNALKGSVLGVVKGFKSLKFAIIASGIGALLLAILAVGKAFTNSEEGQNKFAKLMGIIGSVTGNFIDLIAGLGEKIIDVFENPKQSIKDFAKLIKDNITNRFEGLIELIPQLGKSVKQLFNLDFSGAAETAANAVAKVALGTDNLTGSIKKSAQALKELAEEVASDAVVAANIADKRAKADKLDRELITERAQATRDIAELRLKSEQKDKFSVSERIKFLQEANKIEEETTNKAIKSAKLRRDAIVAENQLSGSTKSDLDAEAQAKANIIELDTSRLNLSKRLATRLLEFKNEELASIKKIADEKQRSIDKEEADAIKKIELDSKTESERLKKISQIQDDFKKAREDKLAETNLQKIELDKERKLIELEELGADEEAKANVLKFYAEKIAEENANITKKAGEKEIADAEAIALAKAKILDAQLNTVARGFNLLGQLAGKNKTLQAAALVGEAAVSIAKMVAANNLANVGALATPQAILTGGISAIPTIAFNNVSTGIGVASTIAATSKGLGSLGGGGSAPSGSNGARSTTPPAISSLPPAFNVVGQSDTNQLADAIGGQSKTPQRAYVVASDVTTGQEMDRNIVRGASI